MSSKSSKESPKSNQLNQKGLPIKSRSQEKPFQPNTKDLKPILIEEKISDLNILFKNSDMTRIKTYEIQSDEWFNIFNNIETPLTELEQLTNNEYFAIEQKDKNILSLFIIFPIELLDKVEILLSYLLKSNKKVTFLSLLIS